MRDGLSPERLIELRLTAAGLGGLFPLLREAQGAVLAGRFRLVRLLAAGRQSFIFAALDVAAGGEVVVKQVAFDYRKPAGYDAALVGRLRAGLAREFAALRACGNAAFPQPIALLTGPAVVPAARGNLALAEGETFLVQEKIDGATLRDLVWRGWRGLGRAELEAAGRRLSRDFWSFWEQVRSAGWLYTDVSPTNLLVERDGGRLRVVDAGSVIPAAGRVVVLGYTPAFATPNLLANFAAGTPVPGTAAVVLPLLAKVLHLALTREEPVNGALPDLGGAALAAYSSACREALASLLDLDAHPERLPEAEAHLSAWAGGADVVPYPPV